MKSLGHYVDLFLYTSLLTACCATGLCLATEHFISGVPTVIFSHLHVFVFGGTLVVYNMPRIFRKPFDNERAPLSLMQNYRLWYFVCFGIGAAMALGSLVWLQWKIALAFAVLGMLAFSYSLPLLPFGNKRRLRDFGWLKIMVLAGVWTIVTSILPILYHNQPIGNYPFEILLRFVFIFTLCVIFDIRDMPADLKNNIRTLPNKVGLKNSYRLINFTLSLFVILSMVQYVRFPSPARLAGALVTAVITKIVVGFLKKHPSNRAYMALADGVMLLYALLVIPFS